MIALHPGMYVVEERTAGKAGTLWRPLFTISRDDVAREQLARLGPSSHTRRIVKILYLEEPERTDGARRSER